MTPLHDLIAAERERARHVWATVLFVAALIIAGLLILNAWGWV